MFTPQLALLLLVPSAYAACINDGRACSWTGTAPFCGGEDEPIGKRRGSEELVAKSHVDSAASLLSNGKISTDCYNDYGSGCWSGGKSLWCAVPKTAAAPAGKYTYTYTTNKDKGYKIVITPEGEDPCESDAIGDDIDELVKEAAIKCISEGK